MTGRGIARATGVVVLLAALGVAGGYAYADLHGSEPSGQGAGTPVAASRPSFPGTRQLDLADDSDLPPVATGLDLVPARIVAPGGGGISVMVPDGWERVPLNNGTIGARWTAPGNPPGSYSVRVTLLDTTQSPRATIAGKIPQLQLDTHVSYLKILDQTDNSLVFTYVFDDKYRIEQVDSFLSLTGGAADVEVATSGRLVDDPGMRDLVPRMISSVERLPTPKAAKSSPAQSQ